MPTIVGVKLRNATRAAFYQMTETTEGTPEAEGSVVVNTDLGEEFGHVVSAPQEPDEATGSGPFRALLRVATDDDVRRAEDLTRRQAEAMPVYRELIAEHKLDMKPIAVEFLFEGGRIVFYFVAEERVDFRDLVRDLAARLHARIDMRQVGVRDEARMVGGIGHCGEQLCCSRFGGEFQPVSIRMAKEQDLPLNPQKISGSCGRLMCCLRYEYEAYKDFKGRAPKRNAIVETPNGLGKVVEFDTPRELITMRLEDGTRMTVPLEAMDCAKAEEGCTCPCRVRAEMLPEPEESLFALAAVGRTAPAPARPGGGRGSGGGGGGGRPKQRQPRESKQREGGQKTQQQPARQQQAKPAAAETPDAATRPRRRRRRRSGGGGPGGSEPSAGQSGKAE